MLCTSYDNLQDDVAEPLGISMQNVGYMNPAFAGADGGGGNVINLQDDNKNVKKGGIMADWEDFTTESSSDPSDVKLHTPSDTDSGIVPIVGVSQGKGRADSFSSAADEGPKKGRLNKWYLFSLIFDRILLVGFVIMIIVMFIAYGTM